MARWDIKTAQQMLEEYEMERALEAERQALIIAYSKQAASALPTRAVASLRIKGSKRHLRRPKMGIEIMSMSAEQDHKTGHLLIRTEIAVSMQELVTLSHEGQFPDLIADKLMMKMRKEIEATVRRLMGKG